MAKVSSNMEIPMCKGCSKLFNENDFYYINKKYIPYCKECCEELSTDNGTLNIDIFESFLKKIDKIFSYKCWQELQDMGEPYFKNYLDLLKKSNLINKKYKDSDTPSNNEEVKGDKKFLEKWGVNSMSDVEFLENEYHEWEVSYEINSKAMVDSVKQLCLVELDIRKARKDNDVVALDKLLRLKSQILGDANLKPVQETGNAANEQVSIGMLIKKFEQERPIPEDTEPDWIDEMKTWIVGQLARMEGLTSDVSENFNKELDKYGIDVEAVMEDGDT
ncbi:MAG: hypothetical protein J6T10_24900 [Methanobrevibacter sp.]|jgi:hypothetical protein|nr:hypothetical protein [Methanobrevibacter sp.]